MIITKDNLLRFIREKKYVTPTIISEKFETSTMIASAALSELAKDKLIGISNIKIGSTPYYYDLKQKESLIELGEKHLSGYDKEAFQKIKEQQIINDASLTIQLRLAIDRIKDFAIPLIIKTEKKELKFWVWYLRDIPETKKQIIDILKGKNIAEEKNKTKKEISKPNNPKIQINEQKKKQTSVSLNIETSNSKINTQNQINSQTSLEIQTNNSQSKEELFIEKFLKEHYLIIESKLKNNSEIIYKCSLKIRNLTIIIDCIYFTKKPNETQIFKFYTSSQSPKLIFISNAPKKLIKLSEGLENLEIISI